jgi:diamine N-acetyltransferase
MSQVRAAPGLGTAATPILRGRSVYLRAGERADVPQFVRWMNDARMARFLTRRAPIGHPDEERWFEGMVERQGREGWFFVISLIEGDRPIGTTGLFELDANNGSAGLGISIGDPADWSRGWGTDALNALVDFGFGELRLERIWLDVYDFNARARRSYDKAGFTLEGTLRHAHFHRGRHIDVHRMAILRDEWTALDRPKSWDLNATEES